MSSDGKASGRGWGHKGKGQRRDNDWSRRGEDCNGGDKKVSCNYSPPPVSGIDDEPTVSCNNWQSSNTWQHSPASGGKWRGWNENPVSGSNWQSSNTWQHNPTSGSDWQSSDRWQRSQPAVAAAVDTNTASVQPADTDLNEEFKKYVASLVQEAVASGQQNDTRGTAAAAQKARHTGGAPKAAPRWATSEAMKQGVEAICWGAVANEIAAAHASEYPLPDGAADPLFNSCSAAFFKAYEVKVHYSKHNGALKYLREEAEDGKLCETGGRHAFGFDTPHNIPRLVTRRSGGEDFLIDTKDVDGFTAWPWESLIANLDDHSIDLVVNGTSTPDESAVATDESAVATQSHGGDASDMGASGESFHMIASVNAESTASWDVIHGGNQQPVPPTCTDIVPYSPRTRTIVGCEFVMDTHRHDQQRLSAAKKSRSRKSPPWPADKPLYKWSFMIKRDDGTVCLLEPHRTDTTVDMYEGLSAKNLDVPRNGLGGSNFKGDYRNRISRDITHKLRFDTKKSPPEARRDDKKLSNAEFDDMAALPR